MSAKTKWTPTQLTAHDNGRRVIVTETSRGEWGWEVWEGSSRSTSGDCVAFGYVATRQEAQELALAKARGES